MFRIEVKFKVEDREVSPERFIALLLAEAIRSLPSEIWLKTAAAPASIPAPTAAPG